MNENIPPTDKFKEIFNSEKSDKLKTVYLLKNIILLGKLLKFPTAKEIALEFFNSNVNRNVKLEVADYLLKEIYMSPQLLAEFPPIKVKSYSPFIKEVINSLDNEIDVDEYLGADFNFVRREVIFWLIEDSEEPKYIIQSMLKEKLNWSDFPTQNGILDYCFQKKEELGKIFIMDIFNRAIKVNMGEVRRTALRYAYLTSKNEKYLSIIKKDSSKHVNNLFDELTNKPLKPQKTHKPSQNNS